MVVNLICISALLATAELSLFGILCFFFVYVWDKSAFFVVFFGEQKIRIMVIFVRVFLGWSLQGVFLWFFRS
jgi:hypothetical protein